MLILFLWAALLTRCGLRLAGFRREWIQGPDGKISLWRGPADDDKPLLIIAHGMGDWTGGWRRLLWRIRRNFQIVIFDFPGYGDSPRPAGVSFASLEQLGAALRLAIAAAPPRPYILLGQSLGGWVALREAGAGLSGLARLVLMNPAGAPNGDLEVTRTLLTDGGPGCQQRIRHAIYGAHIPWRQYLLAPLYRRARALPGYSGFTRALSPAMMLPENFQPPAAPVDFIFGTDDHLFGEPSRRWFAEKFPGARVTLLPAGHALHFQAARAVANYLRALYPARQPAAEAPSASIPANS